MADVFISYAREDREAVEKLAALLEAAGLTCWLDRQLVAGAKYRETTEIELNAAKAVVVVWTKHSIVSHWVADEAAAAQEAGKLAPISLDGVPPPLGFRQFQVIDFTDWKGRAGGPVQDLVSALNAFARRPETKVVDSPATKNPPLWVQPAVLIGAAVLAIVLVGAVWLGARDSKTAEVRPPGSVAILLFDSDPALGDMSNSVALALTSDLSSAGVPTISPSRSLRIAGREKATAASILGASFLVDGSIVKDGEALRVIARIEDASYGLTLLSETFTGDAADPSLLVEQLSAKITRAISFSGSLRILNSGRPNAAQFAAEYLRGQQLSAAGDVTGAITSSRKLVRLAPDYGQSRLALSINLSSSLSAATLRERPAILAEARAEVRQAQSLDPNEGAVGIAFMLSTPASHWARRFEVLTDATERDATNTNPHAFLCGLHQQTGKLADALVSARRALGSDPFSPGKNTCLGTSFFLNGDMKQGAETLAKNLRRWPNAKSIKASQFNIALWGGDLDSAAAFLDQPDGVSRVFSSDHVALLGTLLQAITTRAAPAVAATIEACARPAALDRDAKASCMLGMATLGRLDEAFAVAEALLPGIKGASDDEDDKLWLENLTSGEDARFLFFPPAAGMRADPRIIGVFDRLGLLDYWRETGNWPDFCDEPNPICEKMQGDNSR